MRVVITGESYCLLRPKIELFGNGSVLGNWQLKAFYLFAASCYNY